MSDISRRTSIKALNDYKVPVERCICDRLLRTGESRFNWHRFVRLALIESERTTEKRIGERSN